MYLDYKEHNAGVYVIDIEADSLHPTVIWCMCWRNVLTGQVGECRDLYSIKDFFSSTVGAYYVGHNILKFDAPVLARLAGTDIGVHNCIDTLVLSTLYSPSLQNGHSLGAWGERLGKDKINFNDWSKLSDEMVTYCHMDVTITTELFVRLIRTLTNIEFSEKSIWIQHHITSIIEEQRENGFRFDGQRAIVLYQQLRKREEELQDEIRRAFLPKRVYISRRPYHTKAGRSTAIYNKDKERYIIQPSDDKEHYEAYEDVPFNIGSPTQRTKKLTDLGWEPLEFTPVTKKGGGGNPKPFDKGDLSPSLKVFLEKNPVPEVEMIARWMSINGRANMINTWLENWNEDDQCIHGKLFIADTLRFRHQAPNTANIPAVRQNKLGEVLRNEQGYYTYEARDLWVARPGRVLVGTDAAGLELRMLAHYLNRADFTTQVIEGDPHQYNADTVGITRPEAKTLIYAIMYGAGGPKIARTLGISNKEGDNIRTMFLEKLGIGELMEEAKGEQNRGRVSLCDGSQVVCPSQHAALNYKLQGSGARVMALGAILLKGYVLRLALDSLKVGDIHDEWQHDVLPDHADKYAAASIRAIRKAGEYLKLNVPLDAEAKKGLTWAETH